MGTGVQKLLPMVTSVILMWIVLFLIYPHYQYYIDPDGTAYLTIAQRYAVGDYAKAINGYWSPWSCWLTALMMGTGYSAIPASVVVNALGAACLLAVSHSFFVLFRLSISIAWAFCLTLAFFLCYALFAQSFDDLWECFFLLAGFRLLLLPSFSEKAGYWVLLGISGALAYLAKAYAFPYFMANTVICVWLLSAGNRRKFFQVAVVTLSTMLVVSFPWIYALHYKYGVWTTSTAGSLNLSWYLVGHPFWKEGIDILVPPIYPDSPYYWEDAYMVNGATPHFWNSLHYFGLQVLRGGMNVLKLLVSMLQLSVFFPLVAVGICLRCFPLRSFYRLTTELKVLYVSFVLFPLGYVLINFESRYIWCLLPLSMVFAGVYMQQRAVSKKWYRGLIVVFFCLSIVAYPARELIKMYDLGKEEYLFAGQLNRAGISGEKLVSNLHPRLLSRLAYFSGNSFYVINLQRPSEKGNDRQVNTEKLVREIDRYGIGYYLYVPDGSGLLKNPGFDELFYGNLADRLGKMKVRPVVTDSISGMVLYEMKGVRSQGE